MMQQQKNLHESVTEIQILNTFCNIIRLLSNWLRFYLITASALARAN